MAGDVQCHWGAWFRAHYSDYAKATSDFQSATWMVAHTKALNELCEEYRAEAVSMFKENQNKFTVKRRTMAIGGKPDLIVLDRNHDYTVYDVKTGQPRHSDIVQVMLYMAFLPYSTSGLYKGKQLAGCVVYENDRTLIPATAISQTFNEQVRHFLDILDGEAPARVPSYAECCYCDITGADCPERAETDMADTGCGDLPI